MGRAGSDPFDFSFLDTVERSALPGSFDPGFTEEAYVLELLDKAEITGRNEQVSDSLVNAVFASYDRFRARPREKDEVMHEVVAQILFQELVPAEEEFLANHMAAESYQFLAERSYDPKNVPAIEVEQFVDGVCGKLIEVVANLPLSDMIYTPEGFYRALAEPVKRFGTQLLAEDASRRLAALSDLERRELITAGAQVLFPLSDEGSWPVHDVLYPILLAGAERAEKHGWFTREQIRGAVLATVLGECYPKIVRRYMLVHNDNAAVAPIVAAAVEIWRHHFPELILGSE